MASLLTGIGLTGGEIKVYNALLKLGECTKTSLAKESGIAPSNIYDVTNRLLEKGIASKVEKNGIAHFSPANPSTILTFIDRKEEELEKERALANSVLPQLLAQFNETKNTRTIQVFQGWRGLSTVFEEMIDSCTQGDTTYMFGASKGANDTQADLFFEKYSRKRAKKGIQTKIIFNNDVKETARMNYFENNEHYEIRFLEQNTLVEIMCYKDTTCIIILTQDPVVLRIRGKEVAQSFMDYFSLLWNIASKPTHP